MKATDGWVIDCDTHITEPGDVWTSRLAARFQEDAPRIVRDADGRDSWKFGTSQRIIPVGVTAALYGVARPDRRWSPGRTDAAMARSAE